MNHGAAVLVNSAAHCEDPWFDSQAVVPRQVKRMEKAVGKKMRIKKLPWQILVKKLNCIVVHYWMN